MCVIYVSGRLLFIVLMKNTLEQHDDVDITGKWTSRSNCSSSCSCYVLIVTVTLGRYREGHSEEDDPHYICDDAAQCHRGDWDRRGLWRQDRNLPR